MQTPSRARLDTADSLLTGSSLPPGRARLDTEYTTETADTFPVLNISSNRLDQGGNRLDMMQKSNNFNDRGTLKINNGRNSRERRANSLDLLDVATSGQFVDNSPTPLASNKSRAKFRMDTAKEGWRPPPALPLGENNNGQEQSREQRDVSVNQHLCVEIEDSFDENGSVYFNHGLGNNGVTNTTELFDDDKMKLLANSDNEMKRPQKKIELTATKSMMDQIVASATIREDDEASDMSSLSDTISYQQHDRSRRERSRRSAANKPTSSMSVMATLMFKRKSLRKGFSARSKIMSLAPPENRDTVTTSATGESIGHSLDRTNNTLETIDRSLEQHLFQNGMQESQRRTMGIKGPLDLPSPLGAEIDREKFLASNQSSRRRDAKSGRSGKVGWGGGCDLNDMSPREVSTRKVHDMSPGEESSRWASAHNVHDRSPGEESSGYHHRRSTSNGSDFGNSSKNMGIHSSWLIPSPSRVQQLSSRGRLETQPIKTPMSPEDLIDVLHDEPIDPFSGLIGMPLSIGCERSVMSGDGDSYTGLNVFGGASVASSALSFLETPGNNTLDGSIDNDIPIMKSGRPPLMGRRIKSTSTTFDEFDPLMEEEEEEEEMMESYPPSNNSVGSSPLRTLPPLAIPPRHHKDDPLLSKSRYRSPLQQLATMSTKKKKPALRHQRSSSLGSGGLMMGNTCMFGSIALSETSKSPMTPLGDVPSLEWDGSVGHSLGHNSVGQSTGHSATLEMTSGSVVKDQALTTPNQDMTTTKNTVDGEEKDDDDSSYESFSEEYNRPEPKLQIVAKEMKHIIGKVFPVAKPVVKVGRKLLGREKEEAAMKRSEGCLT